MTDEYGDKVDGKNSWKIQIFYGCLKGWCCCNCKMENIFEGWKDAESTSGGERILKEGCSAVLNTGKKDGVK